MSERGILFSAPMVRALLAGTKTQTRRAVKEREGSVHADSPRPYGRPGDRLWVRETFFAYGRWEKRYNEKKQRDEWRFVDMTLERSHSYLYAADNPDVPVEKGRSATPGWHTRPALFMPRAASRILLKVVSVRVERLQAISDHDAIAEGIERDAGNTTESFSCPVDSYRSLWEQINGIGSWNANPLIWVVEFRRMEA
ncbi:hypothetical protein NX786_11340 [Telluria mixta]|uniref:ASCH domain-containing protein n=1 Tax=Telluria mixta TaxID=34071 RepID=A0ABT2BYB9_9BURK|nr:hypothetical protein [Telluria mixta]MCS0629927.1 hypothetical protein [Telluria mixta]WEM96520.1 hypothetical protein P0M04_01865 [Telluria mixta]